MTDKEIKEYVDLYKQSMVKAKELADIKLKMRKYNTLMEDCEVEWRNVKVSQWARICEKYGDKNLLNCYGDIFYVTDKDFSGYGNRVYWGHRVLWNLELTKELYKIEEKIEYDVDGNYNFTDYEINVLMVE